MFNTIFELSASLFQSFMTIWFITRFNQKRYYDNVMALAFSVLMFGATIFGDYFLPGFNLLPITILFVISLVYALMICGRLYSKALLSTCIIHSIIMLAGTLVYSVVSSVINDFDTAIHGSDSVIRYVYVIVVNLLVFVTARLILGLFAVDKSLDIKTSLIMFAASALTLVGLGTVTKIADYEFAEVIKTPIIILTCIFVSINVILYILVNQIQKLQSRKSELQLINERLSFEEGRLNDASTMFETCRKLRHDMKQHLTVISGYLYDEKNDECQAYVKELYSSVDKIGNVVQSGNMVIDYLTNAKLGHLKETQIIVSRNIGSLSDIKDVDLSCIIGNILDNAIEAVKPLSEKRIELIFTMQGDNRIIICRNSINESVLEKNKFLSSTKNNAEEHGLGHKIVASVVESYDGMISYFEENSMFGVQIVLPMIEK